MKNAKINVYKVILQTSKKDKLKNYSFRELFINKYDLVPTTSDKIFFSAFFKDVFKTSEYKDNNKKRKAFRLSKDISKKNETFVIHGVVEGGPYDSGKTSGNRVTKRDSKKFGKNIIIQDDFYFLLQTKLDEKVGILIRQTYGKENIDDIFKPFIKKLFRHSGQTYNAVIAPFIPESIKEMAKSTAIVSELNYQTKNVVINQVSTDGSQKLEGKFNLKITLTPVDESVSLPSLTKWRKMLGNSLLKLPNKDVSLKNFNSKTGYLKSPNLKRPARFEIDKDIIKIKPTIFIEKLDDVVIEENGTPDWQTLKDYCTETLLPELENEVYGEN